MIITIDLPNTVKDGDKFKCTIVGTTPPVVVVPPVDPNPIPIPPGPAPTSGYYASPIGNDSNDGSRDKPWTLAGALAKPLAAGSVLWLRQGTYNGTFTSRLRGTTAAPIRVKAYPGEKVRLDGKGFPGKPVSLVSSVHVWFEGLEVMNSQTDREATGGTEGGSHPEISDMPNGDAVVNDQGGDSGTGCRWINCIIHDCRQGVSLWQNAKDTEVYGCLIYANGWKGPARGFGHGIYAQNDTGTKTFRNNFVFSGFAVGFHAYGSDSARLNNLILDGNTFANCNILAGEADRNVLLGGDPPVNNSQFTNNFSYHSQRGVGTTLNLGYNDQAGGSNGCTVENNILIGGKLVLAKPVNLKFNNNYLATDFVFVPIGTNNRVVAGMPTDTIIKAVRNAYLPTRTHLTIYNGELKGSVDVKSSLLGLKVGDSFALTAVENPNVVPTVMSVTGEFVSILMAAVTVEKPSGWQAPASLRPRLGLFLIDKLPA